MGTAQYIAAGGTLLLHAGLVWLALSLGSAPPVRLPPRPVEVALLRPPPPEPPRREAPRPPEPLPVHRTPPKSPTAAPPPAATPPAPTPTPTAPAPAPAPVAAARPVDEARPAAISVEPAPPSAPVAPRVTDGAAAPRDPPRVVATPAPPARTGPRADASWAGNAPPPYPAMARRLGEEGEVRLDVHVNQEGGVTEVKLKKSSGSALLDQTAIETVKKWRFKPATVDGRPVDEWYYNWKWVFKLES